MITVDPNTTYQSMVGFGASFTDAAAWNVFNSSQRNNIMNALFNPSSGIGLSFLRQPIGATDFSRSFYTYDDGAADPTLSRFSIAHDQPYILPLVTQARSLNPRISIMGSPWSAPAWMKTNNNLIGGSLSDSYVNTYADYLVKFVQAYQGAGAPIAYLSVQNEPQFSPPGYPGMLMSADQQSRIINALVPKLRAAGLNTQLLGWDHNWDNTSYAQQVNNSAGSNVIGSAWHCYAGNPSAQSTVRNAQPSKDIFFTECSGIESGNTFADSLAWQGRNLAIGTTRNWARTVTTWNMALDNNHGPVIGSCTNCMGVATVNGGSVTYNAEYYVLGHLSKFVPPGAVRIASTAQNQGGIENVAFRNPDGTIVLVAVNSGGAQNFQVSYAGQSFGYNLPAGSMATFTWPGSGGGAHHPAPGGPDRTDRRLRRQVRRRGRRQLRQRHRGSALHLQRQRGPAVDGRHRRHAPRAGQVPGRQGRGHRQRHQDPDLGLRRRQPTNAGPPPTAPWWRPTPAAAWTSRTSVPPTARRCRSGTARPPPTNAGPCPPDLPRPPHSRSWSCGAPTTTPRPRDQRPRPASRACTIACVRWEICSLCRIAETLFATVLADRWSNPPISALDRPAARWSRISSSREVSSGNGRSLRGGVANQPLSRPASAAPKTGWPAAAARTAAMMSRPSAPLTR